MIIINGYRNSDEQLEAISNNTVSECESQCEFCELADKCPNNHIHSNNIENSPYAYAMKELDSCYIPDDIAQVECGNKKVTDGIGEHYKINSDFYLDGVVDDGECDDVSEINEGGWEPTQPVFISAQTGMGKNYFIEQTLIPYV